MEQPYFPPWPQAFTRIETRQFGAGRASRQLAPYIDLPVHPLISPRITTLILLDTVHRQLPKSLQIHAFFSQTTLTFGNERSILVFHASTGFALFVGSRNIRPVTSANTIFIGIMRPLKASIGMAASVPAK